MQAFHVQDLPETPWKNGGGRTRELLLGPAGAGIDAFHWRLTLASIAPGDFTFSHFPGVDRKTVIIGTGMRMGAQGVGRDRLQAVPPLERLALDGEQALDATLEGAAIQAFNLMTRRGFANGEIAVHRKPAILAAAGRSVAFYCVQGNAVVHAGHQAANLLAGQALLPPEGTPSLELTCPDGTIVLAASIEHLSASA